jgi:hypothetical protein
VIFPLHRDVRHPRNQPPGRRFGLLEAGVGAGLDRETVKKMLNEDVGAQEVDLEAKTAARRFLMMFFIPSARPSPSQRSP